MFAATPAFRLRPITITTRLLNPLHQPYQPRFLLLPTKSFSRAVKIPIKNTMFEPYEIRAADVDEEVVNPLDQDEGFVNDPPTVFAADRLEAILNNMSKWLVAVVFAVIVLVRHDAEALWAAMGSVLNGVVSRILKKILKQDRPVAHLRSDPGMPSSHAQSIFYFVVFSVLSLVQWLGSNGLSAAMSVLIVALGSYLTWLRVARQLHTVSQVVVGAFVGIIFSTLWLWLWHSIVLKAYVSDLRIRIIIVAGAAGFCVAFALYVVRYWVMEEISRHISRKLPS